MQHEEDEEDEEDERLLPVAHQPVIREGYKQHFHPPSVRVCVRVCVCVCVHPRLPLPPSQRL